MGSRSRRQPPSPPASHPLASLAALGCALAVAALAGCSGGADRQAASQPPVPSAPLKAASPWTTALSARPALPAAVALRRGVYKVGQPYVINGQLYTPAEDPGYDRVGIASWYGTEFHGKETANGELFDMNALSAAHPTLPLPSYAWVTNLANGRTILVRLNDRGPYKEGRIIDLSRGAARALAFEGRGIAQVRVRYAGRAPLEPDFGRERQVLAAQAWSRLPPPSMLGVGAR